VIYKPAVEQLKIGEFISFTEGNITLIAQVYKILTSDAADDFNQADLSFVLVNKYDKIKPWQGEFISANATISRTPKDNIETYINNDDVNEVLNFGNVIQYGTGWTFDFKKFITPAFIGYEKREDNFNFINLLIDNFYRLNKKLVIVDFKGNIDNDNSKKIIAGEKVKLPLNAKILSSLCDDILQGVSIESKAVIEEILLELSEYARTSDLGFIPISQLIAVIDDFYKKSKITPLILLKNKLNHYRKQNIFADKKEELYALYNTIEEYNSIIFDLSNIQTDWQKAFFNNLIEFDERIKKDFYMHVSADENLFDNKIINYLLFKAIKAGIKPIISANYRYLSFDNIFDFCNNTFLFKTYNALKKRPVLTDILQSLPQNTFITIGKLSGGLILSSNTNSFENIDEESINNEIVEMVEEIQQEPANTELIEQTNIENMNNAFNQKPSDALKKAMDLMNSPISPVNIINNDVQEEAEAEKISTPAETTIPEVTKENVLEFENADIPLVEENTATVNQPEIQETQNTENILQLENVNMHEVEVNNNTKTINTKPVEPVMETESESEEPELENADIEDLDFLNDTPQDIMQVQENDDDLLDLIDNNDEQISSNVNDFENIEFDELETDVKTEDFENIPFEEIIEEQNNITRQMQSSEKIPVYEANSYEQKSDKKEINLKEGDLVKHSKYGVGTIKKITAHADKILCHINFDTCGRRLIDPEISEIQKID
ncbi:MAG: hypothetical protein MJ180_00690, partial [Candidatus Gastranaerophilales bacterium]|nr:hypothetical protein [Candidatus Gastranaerophilales bacterium]